MHAVLSADYVLDMNDYANEYYGVSTANASAGSLSS